MSAALLLVCRLHSGAKTDCGEHDDCSPGNDAGHDCANDDCANDCTDDNHNRSSHHDHTAGNNQTVHNQTGDDPGNDNNAAGLRRARLRDADNKGFNARRHIGQRHLVADECPGVHDRSHCGNDNHAQRDHDQADYDRQAEGRSVRCV